MKTEEGGQEGGARARWFGKGVKRNGKQGVCMDAL